MIDRGCRGSPYRWSLRLAEFFLVTRRASPQPTHSARAQHQSTRFRSRVCLLGVSSIRLILWGVIPPNPLILGTSMGTPSFNVYGRILAQEKHITTLDSSKCASRQDTLCAIVKIKKWGHCKGQNSKSLFQRQIASQISNHSRTCRISF
jgi:hypothetical protein